ncbi:hypothetical protein C8J56DRAFT_1103521 [Mycena floridula]|nr:hypothetical protein C8J56DRAFT_1103521 [Mycena floridula]
MPFCTVVQLKSHPLTAKPNSEHRKAVIVAPGAHPDDNGFRFRFNLREFHISQRKPAFLSFSLIVFFSLNNIRVVLPMLFGGQFHNMIELLPTPPYLANLGAVLEEATATAVSCDKAKRIQKDVSELLKILKEKSERQAMTPTGIMGSKDTGLVACEVSPIEGTLTYSSIVGTKLVKADRIEDYTIYPLLESPPHEIPISMGDVYRRCRNPEEVVVSVVIREFSAYVMNALKELTDIPQSKSLMRMVEDELEDDSTSEVEANKWQVRDPSRLTRATVVLWSRDSESQ